MTGASIISAGRKWRRIGWDERALFIRAAVLVPAVHVAVRFAGFQRMQAWATRLGMRPATADAAERTLKLSVLSVNRVKAFSPLRGNCLSQSLTLTRLLHRRGILSTLRLGARVVDRKFDAHAWVEHDGRVLNDTQDVHTRFAALTARTGAQPTSSSS